MEMPEDIKNQYATVAAKFAIDMGIPIENVVAYTAIVSQITVDFVSRTFDTEDFIVKVRRDMWERLGK